MEQLMVWVIGSILILVGGLIWGKQKIQLIHDYHHGHVREQDIPAYTRQMGQGIMMMGLACLLVGVFTCLDRQSLGWGLFSIIFLLATVRVYRAQKKYNGGLFS